MPVRETPMPVNGSPPMLVFDGECSFCQRSVRFVLARERRSDLLFVPRSSPRGVALRAMYGLQQVESLVWIEGNRASIEWEAVARLAGYVGGAWARLAALADCLPHRLLNFAYRLFARIRKRVAGAPRSCLALSEAQRQRFLE